MADRRLQLIPWEPTWLAHQSLDIHAVYRRPQRRRNPETDSWDIIRDDEGLIQWDLTPGMTVRNHRNYTQKGMEYITLATSTDVVEASKPDLVDYGAIPLGQRPDRYPTEDPQAYIRQPSGVRGPWNVGVYLKDEAAAREERIARIRQHVIDQGPDYAEVYERQTDPEYVLPAKYREVAAQAEAVETPDPPKRKRGRPRKVQPTEEAVTA